MILPDISNWNTTIKPKVSLDNIDRVVLWRHQVGYIYPVSKVVGGPVCEMVILKLPNNFLIYHQLAGCFVGIELKPRFLLTVDTNRVVTLFSEGREVLDFTESLKNCHHVHPYLGSIFMEGMIGVEKRLWKI